MTMAGCLADKEALMQGQILETLLVKIGNRRRIIDTQIERLT